MENIYTNNWEMELEKQFLSDNHCRKCAYICSPLSADTEDAFIRNMHNARAYMYYAATQMKLYARAPHAYLPMLFCDQVSSERALALWIGLQLLEKSQIILVCGNRISSGMRSEISRAISLNIPIVVFDEGLYFEVQKMVTQQGGNKSTIKLDRDNFTMAFTSPITSIEKAAM